MKLTITRTYYPTGTNGKLFIDGVFVTNTIELPRLNNKPQYSCIPEGEYEIAHRYSKKHDWHLLVKKVPNRSLILIHPANNALVELKGCIAPVTNLVAPGIGLLSKQAFKKVIAVVYPVVGIQQIFLTIKKQ
jgi:Family of unknown function (DUF5675)